MGLKHRDMKKKVNLKIVWPCATGAEGFILPGNKHRDTSNTHLGQLAPPLAQAHLTSSKPEIPGADGLGNGLSGSPPTPGTWLTTDDISLFM